MPRLRKPESAIDRLVFLKKSSKTGGRDAEGSTGYISQPTLDRAAVIIPKFETGMGKLGGFNSARQKETREKNAAMSVLQTYMKDMWEVKRRHVYRENLPLEVFAYYQLPRSGTNPEINFEGQWIEIAALMIAGETDAIKARYSPMSNPGMDELKEKLEIAKKERKDVSDADKQLDDAQEAVSDLMPEAKKIVDRIIAELEFNLSEKDDASRRRIMRNYGVRFDYTKNEPNEDEDEDDIPSGD